MTSSSVVTVETSLIDDGSPATILWNDPSERVRGGWANEAVEQLFSNGLGEAARDVLAVKEFQEKRAREGKWLCIVRVEAATVSRMDCEIRRNLYHRAVELPCTTGCDMVGTVVEVGWKSYELKPGDRVCAIGLKLGGHARYVSVPCYQLIPVPPDLDALQVACLLRTYVTAYQCLHRAGERRMRRGDSVFVTGGSGCVGRAVIQLARAAGAGAVFAAAGKGREGAEPRKSRRVIPCGREPGQWLPKVEGKMDVVIDSVCLDGYSSSHKALNRTGKLVCIGAISCLHSDIFSPLIGQSPTARMNIFRARHFMDRTTFYDLFEEFDAHPKQYERDLKHLFKLLKDGAINPAISKCVPLHEVALAHSDIEKGSLNGAVVCLPFGFDGPNQPFRVAKYTGDGKMSAPSLADTTRMVSGNTFCSENDKHLEKDQRCSRNRGMQAPRKRKDILPETECRQGDVAADPRWSVEERGSPESTGNNSSNRQKSRFEKLETKIQICEGGIEVWPVSSTCEAVSVRDMNAAVAMGVLEARDAPTLNLSLSSLQQQSWPCRSSSLMPANQSGEIEIHVPSGDMKISPSGDIKISPSGDMMVSLTRSLYGPIVKKIHAGSVSLQQQEGEVFVSLDSIDVSAKIREITYQPKSSLNALPTFAE